MIVGTAGHIDHGKTALVRRLTGVETDRLKEEKARGITIELGFAYWPRPDGAVVGFVDVPGHERLVHTMLAGATGIDHVLLVVAADDGVMPQTREHIAIMHLLGLGRGVVALNKCDLVDDARLAAATAEIRAALAGTALAEAPVLPVSAVTGAGIDRLVAHLDAARAATAARTASARFRLAVDRAFTLAGRGTTVTGTVLSGAVAIDEAVTVSPSGVGARVRSIHAQGRAVERGSAGERCALVLAGLAPDAVRRGDVVLNPALHAPAQRIDATLGVLASEARPIGQWFPVKVHHAASETGAHVVVLRDQPLGPRETDFVQLVLERPIAAAVGDRYVVRDISATRTLGGGTFLDLRGPERRRRTPERRAMLEALARPAAGDALAAALALGGWVDLDAFVRDRALDAEAARRLVAGSDAVILPHGAGRAVIGGAAWAALARRIGAALDGFHAERPDLPGIGLEQLRQSQAPGWPAALFLAAIRRLAEAGEVALDRTWVRRPGHRVTFSPEEERLWSLIAPRLAADPYRPPRVRDVAREMQIDEALVRRLMHMAARRGDTEEIAHDHFFLRSVVEQMAAIVVDVARTAPDGKFRASDFRDRLDNGRKVAIQILEFFDKHGFTIRRQDLRRINPARADFFTGAVPTPLSTHMATPTPPAPDGETR